MEEKIRRTNSNHKETRRRRVLAQNKYW